jgi:hypothetical protein
MGLLTVVLLAGCGGGAHQPEEEIANAAQSEEKAKGDLLLAEVEYAQAQFREAPEEFAGNAAKVATVRREDVKEAHELQAECHEGNGLEPCESIKDIEEAVKEIDREVAGE